MYICMYVYCYKEKLLSYQTIILQLQRKDLIKQKLEGRVRKMFPQMKSSYQQEKSLDARSRPETLQHYSNVNKSSLLPQC